MTEDTLLEAPAAETGTATNADAPAPKKRATKKAAKAAKTEADNDAPATTKKRASKKAIIDATDDAPPAKKRASRKTASAPEESAPAEMPVTEAPAVVEPEPASQPEPAAVEPAAVPEISEPIASEPPSAEGAPSPGTAEAGQPQRKLRWWEKRKLDRKARQAARAAAGGGTPGTAPAATFNQSGPKNEFLVQNDDADFDPGKAADLGPPEAGEGILDIGPKGHGFLRLKDKGWAALPTDCFVHADAIRKNGLRQGMFIKGEQRKGPRGFQLTEVFEANGRKPEELRELPIFEELKAINPNKRYQLETRPDRYTTRVVDMLTPVGRGQRGLIVSPPRAGKTTMLHHIAEAIAQTYPQVHLMVLLVDERPEEVTEFKRTLTTAEVFASSNDQDARSHTRIAELAIERAKRLVEMGDHVFMLMDSITRMARAYNNLNKGGATMSGGMGVGSMEVPRRLFAAARNTRGAGSLTILATALVETGSRMDDLIFQEFKGTGNMELVLDRKIAEQFIWPAVNIFRSGTRREELLLQAFQLEKIHFLRRGLAGHKPIEAVQRVLSLMERYPNNAQMLVELSSKDK